MPPHRFRVRLEALPDDSLLVVRGGLLDPTSLRADAQAAMLRFGGYGISAFAAKDEAALDALASQRLGQFEALTLMTAGALRNAGLSFAPTFRRPHYTIFLNDLEGDIRRLLQCHNEVRLNPHFEPPEATP